MLGGPPFQPTATFTAGRRGRGPGALRAPPAQFELVQVRVTSWEPDARHSRLAVGGHFRLRVRGTWEAVELPFGHVWSFADGRVASVHNVLDSFELRRLLATASCAAA